MGWEYFKYKAKCENCGREGFCIRGDDDWNRSSTHWIGFENVSPHVNAVARKRADARDSRPVCECGNGSVAVGEYLGHCNSSGELHQT